MSQRSRNDTGNSRSILVALTCAHREDAALEVHVLDALNDKLDSLMKQPATGAAPMSSSHEATVEDEIRDTGVGAPHVVLLGAGASRAAFPNGETNGLTLPLMADFAEHVPVAPLLREAGFDPATNIEAAYASIAADASLKDIREQIDRTIHDYFARMSLPARPSLYDHLLLALRPKDVVATFNWDPFLYQAARRTAGRAGGAPKIVFLHGNVLAGYCKADGIHGYKGTRCSKCGQGFQGGPLLYPTADKDYRKDPVIAQNWNYLEHAMEHCFMFTIFGYSAPTSDKGAMALLNKAWGGFEKRNIEQIEFINRQPEDELRRTWNEFVHTHHYDYHSNFYDSWLANHPRRSGEAYQNQNIHAKFIENNPMPRDLGFDELWPWFQPLFDAEKRDST